ncbi:MAG: serine/threonine-protein kinase [Gaiellaceae bacterium]
MSLTLARGRYRVEHELGRGGMATVYLAHDVELDRRVAIKLLAQHLVGDAEFLERFVREARLAARLSHPNVVRVYDAGDADGRPFIVMEYVRGDSLAAPGHGSPARIAGLGMQACAGLQHAHDAGLVHRDIKPANLLVREDGVLKIADFGIARAAESTRQTQVGTLLGTAAYLSPEQIAGGDATPASDIYALGAVLYELLTGRPPYRFDSLGQLAALQAEGAITPVRDLAPAVPPAVEAAVMHALARDPTFRPRSASELAQELAGSEETVTRPLPQEPQPPVRRTRAWLVAAAVVAALAIGLGLGRLGGDGDDDRSPPPAARVVPPPRGATAADQARNLARWLRANSR